MKEGKNPLLFEQIHIERGNGPSDRSKTYIKPHIKGEGSSQRTARGKN